MRSGGAPRASFRAGQAWRLLTALLLLLFAVGAQAQEAPIPPPPVRSTLDERGIDLTSGKLLLNRTDVAIGPSNHHGLSFTRQWVDTGWRIAGLPTMSGSTSNVIVSFGGGSVAFANDSSGNYTPVFQDGSTLSNDRTLYVAGDGTEITFTAAYIQYSTMMESNLARPVQVKFPDGVIWTYHYTDASYTVSTPPPPNPLPPECYSGSPPIYCGPLWSQYQADLQAWEATQGTFYVSRLASITSSTGYQIKLGYLSDAPSNDPSWFNITSATAINNAVEYCSPTASCTLTGPWPTATYTGYSGVNVSDRPTQFTDPMGRTTTYSYNSATGQLVSIRPPGASSDAVTFAGGSAISSVIVAGMGTWNYSYAIGSPSSSIIVTNPQSQTRTVTFLTGGAVTSDKNELNQTTTYDYCTSTDVNCPVGLLRKVTMPGSDANYTTYAYDARGNQTSQTHYPHPSLGGTPIVTSAVYPSTCSNQKTCNKPTSTTDARGQVTIYDWNPDNGELNTVTSPADASGVHPQTRMTYGSAYAWYKNSSGTLVQGPAISMPTSISQCRIATSGNPASCVGTVDEKLATIAYPTSGASNALPSSITVKAGNNSLVATTAVTYDNLGDVASVDGPLPGTADTSVAFYNLARQKTGEIGPDPDDGGAAKYPGTTYNYRADGQIATSAQALSTRNPVPGPAGAVAMCRCSATTATAGRYGRPSMTEALPPPIPSPTLSTIRQAA